MRHYLFRGLAGPFSPAYACVSEQVASAVLRSQLPTRTGALFGDRRLEGGRDGGRPTMAGDRQTRCGSGRGRHDGGSSAPWLGAVLRHRFAITYRHIPSSVCLSVCLSVKCRSRFYPRHAMAAALTVNSSVYEI